MTGINWEENIMKKIFTHSGAFHADDAMACAIARMLDLDFGPIVVRVRELPSDFSTKDGDVAVDVGGCHDPIKGIFDHHQRNGNDDGFAATGKFWNQFGITICGSQVVADRVYLTLLGSIDRADIGISDWSPVRDDWRHISASALISSMNPPFGSSKEVSDVAFEVAINTCTFALKGAIAQALTYCRMQEVIASADRPFPEVLVLSEGGPWQEHVTADDKFSNLLYVIYPSDRGGFIIQCIPPEAGSFGQRKPLPTEWAGLREAELAAATGFDLEIGSELFCHPGKFIGGARTLADVLKLAKLAVSA